MTPEIIFEDNHLLVLNKPAGMLTQPNDKGEQSLEEWGKKWIKEQSQKPGNVYLHAVHRLDRPVSGIVLFARTSKALERLNESLRSKNMQKTYLALVEGKPPAEKGTLEDDLLHDDFQARIAKGHPQAKRARLHYKIIQKTGPYTLVEIELETGRYHQIRAQFSHIGCPIVGDHKYGSKASFAPGTIALHHAKLAITHPTSKEVVTFTVPAPF